LHCYSATCHFDTITMYDEGNYSMGKSEVFGNFAMDHSEFQVVILNGLQTHVKLSQVCLCDF